MQQKKSYLLKDVCRMYMFNKKKMSLAAHFK